MEATISHIPVTRADHYPHEDGACEPGAGPGIDHLDADRITVGVSQIAAGVVSLNVHGPDPLDPYGYEFDLTPESAQALAEQLTDAAADLRPSEGVKRIWKGGRDHDDVWRIDRPSESPLHPTMKPLALVERAIVNSSHPGALVLDPFMGSGSTLIACERTGRISAGIEIDPRYCDVIVARWEAFTDEEAIRG